MSEIVVRPSLKTARLLYVLAAIIFAGAVWSYVRYLSDQSPWLLALPALVFLAPLRLHFGRLFIKMTIDGERLRYETGMLHKSTRTMEIVKVQDVRVDQALGQRMLGVGDISVETAGESSRLTIRGVDRPREVADRILDAARHGAQPGGGKRT